MLELISVPWIMINLFPDTSSCTCTRLPKTLLVLRMTKQLFKFYILNDRVPERLYCTLFFCSGDCSVSLGSEESRRIDRK